MRWFLFVVGIVVMCASARAGIPKIAVLEAVGPGSADHLAHLTDVARATVQTARPDLMVLTRDNLEALLPPGVALADCDAECEVETGRRMGADWVVAVRIAPRAGGASVSIMIYDTGHGLLAGHGTATGETETAVVAAIRAAVATWQIQTGSAQGLNATDHTYGTLDLSALRQLPELRDAAVDIDGLPIPPQSRKLVLRPGMHQLRVQHPCRHVRPSAIRIVGGQTLSLPVEALMRCRVVQVVSTVPNAVIDLSGQTWDLPRSILVDTPGRTIAVRTLNGPKQAVRVPGDASGRITVNPPEARFAIRIRATYRDGSACRAPLLLNDRPVGDLPWAGQLKRGAYRFTSECRVPVQATATIHGPLTVTLREPYAALEAYTLLSENASLLAVGARMWSERMDGMHVGIGFQAGADLDDGLSWAPAVEVLFAWPGRHVDWIVAPALGLQSGLRGFARTRFADFTVDVGMGVRAVGGSGVGGVLVGLGYAP